MKGRKPVEFTQWVTRHGPVIVTEANRYYALRWAAAEPGSFQFPFLDLNRARNWQEFTAALARFPGPGQNFVYADIDGNIGYHATGLLPCATVTMAACGRTAARANLNGTDSSVSKICPRSNPPSGMVVTANQNPFPPDYKYPVSGEFAPHYRSQQIRDLLSARQGFKPADMLAIEKDVYSGFLLYLARQVAAAFDRKHLADPAQKEAVDLLKKWNGQVEKGTAAPMVARLTYLQYRKRVGEAASPPHGAEYAYQMAPDVVQRILEMGGQGWFKDNDAVLLSALTSALEDGRRQQGSSVAHWNYGDYNELTIAQPVGNQLPLVAKYFNVGPIPMSGSSTTVKQTTRKLGPSMRFVADLGDWDNSLNNITVGESGQILVEPLSRSVGRLLCWAEFSDAVPQIGSPRDAGC